MNKIKINYYLSENIDENGVLMIFRKRIRGLPKI